MFTELSVLYAKYRPEKREFCVDLSSLERQTDRLVMEHLKLFWQRVNIVSWQIGCHII